MLIRTIMDDIDGRKWEIFKKQEGEYFYKYYEYFRQCGWRLTAREGDHIKGYLNKSCIEWEFDILVA